MSEISKGGMFKSGSQTPRPTLPFHHCYDLHSTYKMLLAFLRSAVVYYNIKLKVYLYMHGSNNNFLVCSFYL